MRTESNAALEALIQADPDDIEHFLVYADWLQSQGDPRGELIAMQCALEQPPSSTERRDELTVTARARVRAFEEEIRARFGDLVGRQNIVVWRRGFVDHLQIRLPAGSSRATLEQDLALLSQHPSLRLVRRLSLGSPSTDYTWAIDLLAEGGWPATLQEIHLTGGTLDLAALATAFPRLQRLRTFNQRTRFGAAFPNVRSLDLLDLEVEWSKPHGEPAWPTLRSLMIRPHLHRMPGWATALLAMPEQLPALEELTVWGILGDAFCDQLLTSGLLPKLKRLDLTNALTQIGFEILCSRAARFRHLDKILVSNELARPLPLTRLPTSNVSAVTRERLVGLLGKRIDFAS